MTDLRQAAQQALEALENSSPDQYPEDAGVFYDAITALRTALEQQAEPVSHAVIAGALFDFMGWLTTRKERLVLSSTDNASPAVESITEFAKMRGLSLDDAKVQDWNILLPQQQAEPVLLECVTCGTVYADGVPPQVPVRGPVAYMHKETGLLRREIGRPKGADWDANYWEPLYTTPPQHQWVGLTDEDCTRMSAGDKLVAMWAEAKLKEKNT